MYLYLFFLDPNFIPSYYGVYCMLWEKKWACFDHTPPSSAEFKSAWMYTSIPSYVIIARTGTSLSSFIFKGIEDMWLLT